MPALHPQRFPTFTPTRSLALSRHRYAKHEIVHRCHFEQMEFPSEDGAVTVVDHAKLDAYEQDKDKRPKKKRDSISSVQVACARFMRGARHMSVDDVVTPPSFQNGAPAALGFRSRTVSTGELNSDAGALQKRHLFSSRLPTEGWRYPPPTEDDSRSCAIAEQTRDQDMRAPGAPGPSLFSKRMKRRPFDRDSYSDETPSTFNTAHGLSGPAHRSVVSALSSSERRHGETTEGRTDAKSMHSAEGPVAPTASSSRNGASGKGRSPTSELFGMLFRGTSAEEAVSEQGSSRASDLGQVPELSGHVHDGCNDSSRAGDLLTSRTSLWRGLAHACALSRGH